jgi:hypothetical protein
MKNHKKGKAEVKQEKWHRKIRGHEWKGRISSRESGGKEKGVRRHYR